MPTILLFYFRVFSLLITVVFQMLILRDIEKYIGWYAMAVVYLGSGVAGSLGSAIFLPYHVEVTTMATRMHSSRMRTARSSIRHGRSPQPPEQEPPWSRYPPASRHNLPPPRADPPARSPSTSPLRAVKIQKSKLCPLGDLKEGGCVRPPTHPGSNTLGLGSRILLM